MIRKGLYLAVLACYVAAVFLVTGGHFWAGIVCMGAGTCFIGAVGKGKFSSGQEDVPKEDEDKNG